MTRGEIQEVERFVEYLRFTLIPDLKESGHEATAEDFETAIDIIRDLLKERDERR